ncbi:hypothetical protein NHX12_009916, partial [Muraenolepis orangiensis]
SLLDPTNFTHCWPPDGLMPESSCWQLCPPSKPGLQGGLLSSSFPPGPVPLMPQDPHLQEGGDPLDQSPPFPHQHSALAPSARQQYHGGVGMAGSSAMGGGAGVGGGTAGPCPLRAPSSSLNSSLHSSSSPTFFSLALSPDSPLPWSFPWDPSEAAGGGACCCFFPSPSSCSSSPSPLHPPPPPHRRFSLSPVLIRDSAASTFPPPQPVPCHAPAGPPPPPPGRQVATATAGGPGACPAVPASPSSACSTPSSLRRALPPQLPRCHSQPCDLLLLKPGLKRRRDPDRPCARPVLDFTKMTQTRSMDPHCLERGGGRLACGGDICMGLEPFLGDFRGSCSPAEGLGRTSIGPLSESDEECGEEEEEDDDGEEEEEDDGDGGGQVEGGEREAAQQAVFERDCTELDLNMIEEN